MNLKIRQNPKYRLYKPTPDKPEHEEKFQMNTSQEQSSNKPKKDHKPQIQTDQETIPDEPQEQISLKTKPTIWEVKAFEEYQENCV